MIIEMVNEIIIGNGDLVNHHIRAIENLSITDNRALQIFYEYQGYYLLMKKDTQNGLILLEKAKTLYYDEKTIAMIHYHMCFAHNYECLKRYDFDIIRQALEVFQKYHSYRRVENTMMIYGNFYDTKRNYNKALESYESCLNLSQLANENKSTFANLYRTISHLQLKNRKYIESLIYLEKARLIEPYHPRMHLQFIWCYYKQNDIENANRWIVKMQRLTLNKELKMLWKLYHQLIHQYNKVPNNKLLNQAIKVYDYYEKEDDLDLMLFYIDIVIELYERKEDYKAAFLYQKVKIKLLENI